MNKNTRNCTGSHEIVIYHILSGAVQNKSNCWGNFGVFFSIAHLHFRVKVPNTVCYYPLRPVVTYNSTGVDVV